MSEYNFENHNVDGEKIDPMYKKGFEDGYWLTRGNSREFETILRSNKNHDYGSGLKGGRREAEREQVRERFKANDQTPNRNKDSNRNKDLDRG